MQSRTIHSQWAAFFFMTPLKWYHLSATSKLFLSIFRHSSRKWWLYSRLCFFFLFQRGNVSEIFNTKSVLPESALLARDMKTTVESSVSELDLKATLREVHSLGMLCQQVIIIIYNIIFIQLLQALPVKQDESLTRIKSEPWVQRSASMCIAERTISGFLFPFSHQSLSTFLILTIRWWPKQSVKKRSCLLKRYHDCALCNSPDFKGR